MSLPALVSALTVPKESTNQGQMAFPDALECVHVTRYTGAVVIHFLDGKPKSIEVAKTLLWKLA